MVRITCPHCASALEAKDKLIGQVRKCPKCGQPIKIVADSPPAPESVAIEETSEETPPDKDVHATVAQRLPSQHIPERLTRDSHYVICNRTGLVAVWQNDGHGWMMKSGASYVSAKRNRENLPTEGDFKLVELRFKIGPEGRHLVGVVAYQLVSRWALTVLHEGDDQITAKIAGLGSLNRDQKFAVRQVLKEQFMPEVFERSADVLEYLSNADYHSPGVGWEPSGDSELPHLGIADFLGAVLFVDARPPKGIDFGDYVFERLNPAAARSLAERSASARPQIEVQNLGSFDLTDTGFVEHAHQLAHEDPDKGHQKCVLVFQEDTIHLESGGKYHTLLCSYFRARDARDVVLPAGESLDGLLQ